LSCLDRFSILTVTNVIHDPFRDVDRLGLAISQFGAGFLGRAHFGLGEYEEIGQEALYLEQIIGMLRVARVVHMTFFGGKHVGHKR
jgi:hypothetical protein